MATLIGNIVLLLIAIIVIQKITGSNNTINQKTRNILRHIDDELSEKNSKKEKKKNPNDYCSAKELMTAATLITHNGSKEAREDLQISEKAALRIRRKILKEIASTL
tara:strand:- start:560 stop:880 length:321 start_codon:yes stop_codon:yes gene_type:complete